MSLIFLLTLERKVLPQMPMRYLSAKIPSSLLTKVLRQISIVGIFGDPTTLADTSNEKNPWYVYPGNGDYTVTLKVTNEDCSDTYKFTVKIRSTQTFNLGPDVILCPEIDYLLDPKTPDATALSMAERLH